MKKIFLVIMAFMAFLLIGCGEVTLELKETEIVLTVGDVYEIEGEDFIYIINNEYSSSQLQLTKQKYFELFPPIERFATTQNQIGNCWEISVLQGLFSNPQTRPLILSVFSQKDENIIVVFKKRQIETVSLEGENDLLSKVSDGTHQYRGPSFP